MDKLSINLQANAESTSLSLSGVIDEDNNLGDYTAQITGSLLIIDLEEILRINSCGVRDWVDWLREVESTGILVVLTRCSPAIVGQINMVPNFCGDAKIYSFFAPYFDNELDEEKTILLLTHDFAGQSKIKAPKHTNAQGEALEFDDYEESFFAFVPQMLKNPLSEAIRQRIQRTESGSLPRETPATFNPEREFQNGATIPSIDPASSASSPVVSPEGLNSGDITVQESASSSNILTIALVVITLLILVILAALALG